MRKLGVYDQVMRGPAQDGLRKKIQETAARLGFAADILESREELAERIGAYEILYTCPDPALLKRAERLKWLCTPSAGVDQYLDDSVWPHPGCLLSNSSGAYGPTISEHILMVLLMLMRRMPEYAADLRERKWTFFAPIRSITGSRIVMLGTGDIGANAARRLRAMGASVTGVCRSGTSGEPAFDSVVPIGELDRVLPQAGALIMALPATPATVGILSRERIALLPESAYVINVGRGSAVDQEALAEALRERRIAGASLDVMTPEPLPEDDPLWECPNLLLTPHISGNMSLGLTCQLAVDMFCADLERYAAGEPLKNLVDRKRGY